MLADFPASKITVGMHLQEMGASSCYSTSPVAALDVKMTMDNHAVLLLFASCFPLGNGRGPECSLGDPLEAVQTQLGLQSMTFQASLSSEEWPPRPDAASSFVRRSGLEPSPSAAMAARGI